MAPHQQQPPPPSCYESHALSLDYGSLDADLFLDAVDSEPFVPYSAGVSSNGSTCRSNTPYDSSRSGPVVDSKPAPTLAKKGEKRKQQIREASRRCRIKQKDEVAYLRLRVNEMEQVLRDLSASSSSALSTAASDKDAEVSSLRRHNQHLTLALEHTTKQLRFIQTLMQETIHTATSLSTSPPPRPSSQPAPSEEPVHADKANAMAALAATAAAGLMSFVVEKGVQVMSISSINWVGDVWMEGSQVRFALTKSFSGAMSRTDMADRVWRATTALPRCGTSHYTLISQECVMDIHPSSLRVMRRVESLMEMRLLEHWSVVFRHEVDAHSTLVGSQSVAPFSSAQYTLGKEQQGILVTTTDDAVHAELRGMYECVGVPESEVAARVSKDILSILVLAESTLVGANVVPGREVPRENINLHVH
ncbi:hypothetical protein DYB25_012912 [Aphanomyces astaci]|uniref:BZIP domain-containing protein n=1 Tax=Aphanomyces astaci TaxID=112090 RepID=A0A397APN9_APHAT|nr:hypothetical protein DYB25_012912 [Aphanomyces astaci]